MFTSASRLMGASKVPINPTNDPFFSSVVALLHMDGTVGSQSFPDVIGRTFTTAAGTGVKIVSDPSGSSGTAASFDGTTDGIITGQTGVEAYRLHGDFTMEAFVTQAVRAGVSPVIAMGNTSGDTGLIMYINASGFLDASSGQNNYLTGNIAITLSQRTHVAVTRQSGTLRVWVGGQLAGSISVPTDFTDGFLDIGGVGPYRYQGLIDEVRVTNGVSRYNAPFTPATAPFPDQ